LINRIKNTTRGRTQLGECHRLRLDDFRFQRHSSSGSRSDPPTVERLGAGRLSRRSVLVFPLRSAPLRAQLNYFNTQTCPRLIDWRDNPATQQIDDEFHYRFVVFANYFNNRFLLILSIRYFSPTVYMYIIYIYIYTYTQLNSPKSQCGLVFLQPISFQVTTRESEAIPFSLCRSALQAYSTHILYFLLLCCCLFLFSLKNKNQTRLLTAAVLEYFSAGER